MINKIKIEKLFNQFDYELELEKDSNITILTGPNGFGKTTILKLLNALSNSDYFYLKKTPFSSISVYEDDHELKFFKNDSTLQIIHTKLKNVLKKDSEEYINEIDLEEEIDRISKIVEDETPLQFIKEENIWLDRASGSHFNNQDFGYLLKNDFYSIYKKLNLKNLINNNIYLIREQRLLRKGSYKQRRIPFIRSGEGLFISDNSSDYIETIKQYSDELSRLLKDEYEKSSERAQALDSTFPHRLFEQTDPINEDEFRERFNEIKRLQNQLSNYGLSISQQERETEYKSDNAKALRVYLDDTEQKLKSFDKILKKLNLFTEIINDRRFIHKKLSIKRDEGIIFKTSDKDSNELRLTDLSSGEQQEIVLLYDLLFKVQENTLVLIDEPEISLHVAWQKAFLSDMEHIAKLQKINLLIATHSPQIIGDRWDSTIDLANNSGAVS